MVSQQKQRGRRHGIASQLYSSRICCVQCVPIFPISRTFKNAALLHPPSNEWEALSLSCYCICDKKQSKRDFFNGLTLVVVLASGDADVAGFKVPFRIRAGIWTEIKVFSQDVTFGKVIATAKRKQQTFRKKKEGIFLRYWLVGKDFFGFGRKAIDAPSRHTLVVTNGDGKAAVIGTRDFDDFTLVEAFQMQTCPLAGESRFFSLEIFFICSAAGRAASICKDSNWVICMMRICPFFLHQCTRTRTRTNTMAAIQIPEELAKLHFLATPPYHTAAVAAFSLLLLAQTKKSFDI